MKRKILSVVIATVLMVSLTACNQTENEVQSSSVIEESSAGATEEIVASEEIISETELASQNDIDVTVHEGIVLNNGTTVDLLAYNDNCDIVDGLRKALGTDLYPGITIQDLGNGDWLLYYEGEPQAENSIDLGFYESEWSEETTKNVISYLSNDYSLTAVNNGEVPAFDLNEDGVLSCAEVLIVDLLKSTDNFSFTGLFQIESGVQKDVYGLFTKEVELIPISEYLSENVHTYNWGIMEFGGEYSMEIFITSKGNPSEEGSTIDFCVRESIFDHKLFTEIKCEGSTLLDKNIKPEWVDSQNGGDGIIGFVGDGFEITADGTTMDENGCMVFSFCWVGNVDGSYHEYRVVWEKDGSVTVGIGDLVEQ